MNWWQLRIKVHSSWLIAVACFGVVVGVIVAPHIAYGWFYSITWLLLGLLLFAIGLWRGRRYALPVMLIAGSLLGLWRGSGSQQQLVPYQHLIGYAVTIRAVVTEDADIGKNGELLLRLGNVVVSNHQLPGHIWASTSTNVDVKRGDVVTLSGKLTEGFGSFAASLYRGHVKQVQRPQPGDVARQVRDGFAEQVRKAVPEPQASLGIGYLVGQRRALPLELSDALRIAGLTHVIVASGYNLTILVRLARRLFVKVSKYLAALSASAMIVSFIAVTGMSPSMSRAGLVAGLSLLAWYYGRKFHPVVLLLLAAAVTLLINPSYGWNDLGWQLSFAAFAGVMILAPLLQRYLFGDTAPGTVRQILGETIAAQIATLPLLIMAFGVFSNVAIIANLLILPLVPLAMLLTFITGIGTIVAPATAVVIGVPVTWLLHYMTNTATYLADQPWAQTIYAGGPVFAAVYYGLLIGVCLYIAHVTQFQLRESNIVE
ncbi:MAG: ComEC/Rec2 family competence protein [Candidatus Saccharimonadales bacterium]